MYRRILTSLIAGLCLAGASGHARAVPEAPSVGHIPAGALDAAREEVRTYVPVQGHEWEDGAQSRLDYETHFANPLLLNSTDDDACHYARGSTLVIQIFIDHTGGSWDATGRTTMSARSRTAKDHYLGIAPAGANLHFDHDGNDAFYYYNVTVAQNIPDSGMTSELMETVVNLLGFSDGDGDGSSVDDFSLWLMNWNGGWDNVILCFHPKVTGRAWASYGHAKCALYSDDTGNVFAHEWGHLFGSCDEYVEGGHCNGSIDCGTCQSWYLDDLIDNGNCQLASCPMDVSCIMINNTFSNVCDYTLNHWGWVDEDNDGLLDWTKRRTTGNNFVNIYLIPHNGYALWNNTTDGYVISQQWNTWSAAGLRNPSGSDYDLKMYGDFNHNYLLASSSYGSSAVDFVVSDYNHDRPGNEHLQVNLFSGAANNYRLNWESGTGMLYPDGVVRSGSWSAYQVVRAYDVPLFGGETVTFTLDITSGAVDLGMALFKSNGDYYHVGRSSAQWTRDAGGAGVSESYTYTVPSDDVYGLILFANNADDSGFTIQIGPTPYTLAEESPFNSALDLRLFNYDPNAFYWSFVGTRPIDDGSTNVSVGLYDNSTYQTELATSSSYPGTEFVAADYNPGYSTDYLRVNRTAGSGTHKTEWEHDADLLAGVANETWDAGHVGKVWDVNLVANQTYFLREYHGGSLDTGIYIFDSSDGDRWKPRNAFAQASNFRPASDGGEWFSYTAPANDWYGVYTIVNDESSGSYSLWFGPKVNMIEDDSQRWTNEVVFGSATVGSRYWSVFAVRPYFADNSSIWLYADDAYTITSLKANDQTGSGVNFVVGDFNHNPLGTYYPRIRRTVGTQGQDFEWEGGSEGFSWSGSTIVSNQIWDNHDVADVFDLYVDGGVAGGRTLTIEAEDLSNNIDIGLAVFGSNGAEYWGTLGSAIASANANPVGGTERVTIHFTQNDWYGIVLWSDDDVDGGGTYRLKIYDPATVSVDASIPARFDLQSITANPFASKAGLSFSLTKDGPADLSVYDVNGRRLRSLINGQSAAGNHDVVWDGKDEDGSTVPSGIYFARLRSEEGERLVKLVRQQ
jgi:hypothetical protein